MVDRFFSRFLNARVMSQSEIVVGANHYTTLTVGDDRGACGRFDWTKKRINSRRLNSLGVLKAFALLK